jgi:succinate dehydrogenase / fumarate reductase membrane anchor subunit
MSGKHGTGHFIGERVSAIALLVLLPWFIFSVALGLDGQYDTARAWLAQPINAIGLSLFLLVTIYHAQLGVSVVVDDYIARPFTRGILLLLNTLLSLALAGIGLWAIYRISLGG